MTLQQLRYIIAIAETGSYSKAAESMFVAQPSITSSVKELEKEFDIHIFERNGRGATLTQEGQDFLVYARQVVGQADSMYDRFGKDATSKHKFGVSAQHYSFVTKSFLEMAKKYNMAEFEFAIRECKTMEVIEDVHTQKSELGFIYLSDYNRNVMQRILKNNELEFHTLVKCAAFVYLYKEHPLAVREKLCFEDLSEYPCLMFEQGEKSAGYLAEEILSNKEYPQIVWANDRGTMMNLMIGLNGYTLCSGIICEEMNNDEFVKVPYEDASNPNTEMEIGYITREGARLTKIGRDYIDGVKAYLNIEE